MRKGIAFDSVAGAALALATGDVSGAVAAGLAPITSRLLQLTHAELTANSERAGAMWSIAGHQRGISATDMIDLARGDGDRRHLGYTAAEAATQSRYPARIIALGRALARGVLADDDAVLDEAQLVVDALAEVDRPHLVLLAAFANIEGTAKDPVFVRRTLSWPAIQRMVPNYGRSTASLLAKLDRLGLVHRGQQTTSSPSTEVQGHELLLSGTHWSLSDFGYLILEELWTAGGDETVAG